MGGQQLEGKIEKLEKPIAVLKKCDQVEAAWNTAGLINKKIVFKNKSKNL